MDLASNNSDKLNLTKQELVQKIEIFVSRVQRNPKISWKVKETIGICFALFKSRFARESDLQYAFPLFCDFFDDIRALNARKNKPELATLNPVFDASVNEKLGTIPEEKQSVVFDFTRNLKFGAMKE